MSRKLLFKNQYSKPPRFFSNLKLITKIYIKVEKQDKLASNDTEISN